MRLLLAEDDQLLGRATCRGLGQLGHAVDWVVTGRQAFAAMETHTYDCIILDLGLPEMSGEECLRALRRVKRTTAVIVATARQEQQAKLHLLELGADDYVTKPFDIDELAARARALYRRAGVRTGSGLLQLVHGALSVLPASKQVTLRGKSVELTNKEFWLLEVLMRNWDRIVTRRTLEDHLYGWDESRTPNALEVSVYQLRRKLGTKIIRTVRGVGYQLAVPEVTHEAEGPQHVA
jgi:DNA-binding response OmpR family regulator